MGFAQAEQQTPENPAVFDDAAHIQQLRAENQKLRNMVIEKELEIDALHQRLNCIIDGLKPLDLTSV